MSTWEVGERGRGGVGVGSTHDLQCACVVYTYAHKRVTFAGVSDTRRDLLQLDGTRAVADTCLLQLE